MTGKLLIMAAALCLALSLSGCGRDKVKDNCEDPQPYQSIVPSKRVVSPEGLDPLDEFREMPIPKAETAPRPPGSRCIESPPSVRSGS